MKKVILSIAAGLIALSASAVCFTSEPLGGGQWKVNMYHGESASSGCMNPCSYSYGSQEEAQIATQNYNSCCVE